MTKVAYIISGINRSLAFEWIVNSIDINRFKLYFILLNPGHSYLENFLEQHKIPYKRINYYSKKDIPKAFIYIFYYLLIYRIQVVHCHLQAACLIGLSAAFFAMVKKRIYTRHHSTFHHIYYPKAVKYDRIINKMASSIIAISKNVYNVLLYEEKVPENKVYLIHHGFDLNIFNQKDNQKIELLREKYEIRKKSFPVIGVISRYTEWKGVQYIIPAFRQLLYQYPNALLIIANATGEYKKVIHDQLKTLPSNNYREIVFEPEIPSLYQLFNVYVHVPIDSHSEAFGQTYIEALAAGIPSVFTLSGVANEFIQNKNNAIVVDYKNVNEIFSGMKTLIENDALQKKLIKNGKKAVESFNLLNMMQKLEALYAR